MRATEKNDPSVVAHTADTPTRWRDRLTVHQKQVIWAWVFLALPVLFYSVIRFYPTFNAFYLSFNDWAFNKPPEFIGLDNYIKLFNDPVFWKVFKNTFVYLFIGTPVSLVISFVVAFYLDKVRFLHGLIRAMYFIPFLTTAVAMAWVWRWFYQPPPVGFINAFLGNVGLPQQDFLRSTTQALPSILVVAIWAGLGFQIIIFMAGLRAIPGTYYEAAEIDGVSAWGTLTRITLPLLKPTIVFLIVFSSIGFLRIFDQVFNMTTNDPGGPLNSTKPLVLMIYQTAFSSFKMGYAAAQTVVLFTVLLIISGIQLRLLRDK